MPKIPPEIGKGGAHLNEIRTLLYSLVDDLTSVKAELADLKTKYNAHTHTANDTAIIAGQRGTVSSTITTTK
jgi:hypothetical protein